MSTEDILLKLEAAGILVRVQPRFHGREREVRRMSLLKDPIHDWTVKNGSGQEVRAAARVHFGVFVKGETVDDRDFMKRVSRRQRDGIDDFTDEVWSVRAVAQPQHRFFGAFACPDWFLILNMQSRNYLGKHPDQWHKEIDKTIRIWDRLFPLTRRYSGTKLSHYVTCNSEHADERWQEY